MEMFSKKTGERDFLLRYACDGGDFYARSSIRGRTARLRYQKLGNLTQKIESQM
jgi:hypothetical protein